MFTANPEVIGLTLLVAVALSAIHIWAQPLHRLLFREEEMAASFSGGMAITYVFIHLLPELDQGEHLLGTSIYLVVLLGFLIFYGMQSLVWQNNGQRLSQSRLIFAIELGFYSLYNGLLIYAIPEQFKQLFPFTLLYLISISFHILHNDYGLTKKHRSLFSSWGRYCLVSVIFMAFFIDVFTEPANEVVSDFLIAILAGSIMFNVFYEELPSPKSSSFGWFLAGVCVYVCLRAGMLFT
ncbi:MAG: hypothetical protein ACFB4I_22615 [Cyanophyceae cyanobacterium]